MLKCIICDREYPERINFANDGCHPNPLYTTLYRTSIPFFPFDESPLEQLDRNTWMKREDKNDYSHCFKDRKARYVLSHDKRFALASCGNQALAFDAVVDRLDLFAVYLKLYLPESVSYKRLALLRHWNPTIVDRIWSTKELIEDDNTVWNITNGMDPIGASAIYSLAFELEKENFDNIVVPMGSGELYSMLSVYFKLLRKKKVNIIPVTTKHPSAYAINTNFVPMTPFIEYFKQEPVTLIGDLDEVSQNAERIGCSFSSAVVFSASKFLKGDKTCLVITGA